MKQFNFSIIYAPQNKHDDRIYDALDYIYEEMCDAIQSNDFDYVSRTMKEVDFYKIKGSLSIPLAFLSTSLPFASKIEGRAEYYNRLKQYIIDIGQEYRVERLLLGLDNSNEKLALKAHQELEKIL